ncbi:MAG: hypothetical protein ABSE81_07555 [Candidatus Omnitrophota bacterium]
MDKTNIPSIRDEILVIKSPSEREVPKKPLIFMSGVLKNTIGFPSQVSFMSGVLKNTIGFPSQVSSYKNRFLLTYSPALNSAGAASFINDYMQLCNIEIRYNYVIRYILKHNELFVKPINFLLSPESLFVFKPST